MARKSGSPPAFMKETAQSLEYQKNFQARAEAGILPPNLEIRMWEYCFGKPAEEIDLFLHQDFQSKSTEELLQVAASLQQELVQLRELSNTVH
jgi:hypothetical protein